MADLQNKLEKVVNEMPAFPNSVTRIMQLTSDIDCSPKDIVDVIDHDPVMTMNILKLVNSAYFGLSRKIISIKQGVVFIGVNTIKQLALTVATIGRLPKETSAGLNMNDFLLHSLGTATISRLLGQRLEVSPLEVSGYFVAGLLHDFGKVVFAQFMPTEFEKAMQRAEMDGISLYEAEKLEIGADHAQIGGMLGEKWQLPPNLVICIQDHHSAEAESSAAQMCDCVIAANLIIKQKGFGNAGNPVVENLPNRTSERFGMDRDELSDALGDIDDDLDKARLFLRL
ncbi:MAG: HDOD domain-containing protein [Gammaproteobacteria bacterium]|nr:HDOD domain-containing protein [Gammaproteobacteria bacterium]